MTAEITGRLIDSTGLLSVLLAQWARRGAVAGPEAIRAGHGAVGVIDAMTADLREIRAALVSELRADAASDGPPIPRPADCPEHPWAAPVVEMRHRRAP